MLDADISARARFDKIRYAQVWEDADILLAALCPPAGARLASIASAGDNVLALLASDPEQIVAIDLSAAQLHCLTLRIEAYRTLNHGALLELMGSRQSDRRRELLALVTSGLPPEAQKFWAAKRDEVILHGLGGVGKFERYFRLFRRHVLPLAIDRGIVRGLFEPRNMDERRHYYTRWNGWRWRLLLRLFFSPTVMGHLGRDPAFFDFAEASLHDHLSAKIRNALVDQCPADNPYLHWILTGTHGAALPFALREENFEMIRSRLGRVALRHQSLESFLAGEEGRNVDGWNLSDVFEYLPPSDHAELYRALLDGTAPGGRLVYWNMIVPRRVPEGLADRVVRHGSLARDLAARDKAFFYSAFIIEERIL